MTIDAISAAAYRRQPPDGMTLAEIKLYYSLVLLYTLNRLGQLTVEEGQAKKKEFIDAYHRELGAVDFMRENPEMKCKDALRALRSRESGSKRIPENREALTRALSAREPLLTGGASG